MSTNAKNASVRGTELELGERNLLTSTDLVIFAEEPQDREQKKSDFFDRDSSGPQWFRCTLSNTLLSTYLTPKSPDHSALVASPRSSENDCFHLFLWASAVICKFEHRAVLI